MPIMVSQEIDPVDQMITPAADDRPQVSPGQWTVFERFIMHKDSPSTPMVFRVLMRFDGILDRDLLSRAYQLAAIRQPMFLARLDQNGEWHRVECNPRLNWKQSSLSQAELVSLSIPAIEISREIGLRTTAFPDAGGVLILLDFHHACCDGQGARQFIAEWFSIYDQLTRKDAFELSDLDAEKIMQRHLYRKPTVPVTFWEGMRNLYVTLAGKTARIPERKRDALERIVIERPLEISTTADLRAKFKEQGYTINDVGLAASMMAFKDVFSRDAKGKKVTVLNPVDLRYPSDLKVPACNRLGMAFLRRRLPEQQTFRELLTSLRDEMQYVKRKYVGVEFLHGLEAIVSRDWSWRMILDRGWFIPSVQFTCLGDTTRAIRYKFREVDGVIEVGQLRLDRISGIAPVATDIPISIAACETNNRIVVTFQSHTRYVTQEQSQAYADAYMNLLIHGLDE